MIHKSENNSGHQVATGKRWRDPRLDFYRGLAMFIILLAHTNGNSWTLWIPARFGFSDATEIFVFCSGMASALAFGSVFIRKGFGLGLARVAFRVWQVWWAQIGMVLVCAALLYAIDSNGWGIEGKRYIAAVPLVPLFENTGEALLGLVTLNWVPNFFDILPMYIVILLMIPVVAGSYMLAGRWAVFTFVAGVWLVAQFGWFDMQSRPWRDDLVWFFNPFGWQLVFFTGFAFGMKWLPVPPVRRDLVWLAIAVVVASIPLSWFRIHQGLYMPADWPLQQAIASAREATVFFWEKTNFGLWRYLHFLALAYLGYVVAGPMGVRLSKGFVAPAPLAGNWLWLAVGIAVVTAPYGYVNEIATYLPALDLAILWLYGGALGVDLLFPPERIGLMQLLHLFALIAIVWAVVPQRWRIWLCGEAFTAFVPVVRKVGSQSLAVFLTSMPLALFNHWILDIWGRDVWTTAAINFWGFGVLIATAYFVGWIKAQPWRGEPRTARTKIGDADMRTKRVSQPVASGDRTIQLGE